MRPRTFTTARAVTVKAVTRHFHGKPGFTVRGAAAVLLGVLSLPLSAQEGIERRVLQRAELAAPGHEAVLVEVRLAPGAREGRHSHPGTVLAYVLEGELTFESDAQPARTQGPGDSLLIAPGTVHEGINRGATPVRLLATFVVETGKPLAVPAP